MLELFIDVVKDTIIDSVKILPFLYVTYLFMEYLEAKLGDKHTSLISKAGPLGPIFGGLLGVVPQCGFSAAASNLYAGRVISLGTLIAIFLSTSDEMLPLFISEHVAISLIIKILAIKAVIGILAGIAIDLTVKFYHSRHSIADEELKIEELCEKEHGHHEQEEDHSPLGIAKAAFTHTLHIFIFVVILTFILGFAIEFFGKENISNLLRSNPFVSHLLAGLLGLIPNCAASVIITELYLSEMVTIGTMMSGLLVGAGVGLLVLFRTNSNKKQNINIMLLLYLIGTVSGFVIDIIASLF